MTKQRRRGKELEKDIYIATRGIIDETGFRTLTFERVAKKAATSKPVIYRRWKTPFELALAALQDKIRRDNHGKVDEIVLTGQSLREDRSLSSFASFFGQRRRDWQKLFPRNFS